MSPSLEPAAASRTGDNASSDQVAVTMNRIARGGTASLLGAAVAAVLNVVFVVVVVRSYPAHEAGALFAAISLFLIALAIVEVGVDQAFVRDISRAAATGEVDVDGVLRAGLLTIALASVAAGGVGWWSAGPLSHLLGQRSEEVTTMLRIFALALPIAATYELILAATRGHGTLRPTVLIERLARPTAQPIAVAAVVAIGHPGLPGLAAAWLAPYIPALVVATIALRRLPPIRRAAPTASAGSRPYPVFGSWAFWRFAVPLGAARVCQVALQRSDVVLIAAWRGPQLAAVYTAATRFRVLGQLGVQAVQMAMQPWLARLLAMGDKVGTQSVVRRATAWIIALSWPVYLTCCVFATELMSGFGAVYAEGAAALALISVTMLTATAKGPVDVLLLMAGRSGTSFGNAAAALAVDLALCAVLIPPYGVLGAAGAWAAANVLRNTLAVIQTRRQLGLTIRSRLQIKVGAVAVLCFAVVPFAAGQLGGTTGWRVVGTVIGAIGYVVLLWRLRHELGLEAFAREAGRTGAGTAAGRAGRHRRRPAQQYPGGSQPAEGDDARVMNPSNSGERQEGRADADSRMEQTRLG
jgi:O-antigen/teichoic acid export membrane protein